MRIIVVHMLLLLGAALAIDEAFFGPFSRTCTKHSDCNEGFPEEWCMGTSGGKRQCAIMPPVKQTCTQNSECPKAGEECYKKRCVASAPGPARHHHEAMSRFADIPPIQKCNTSMECKKFPKEWCPNKYCVYKPPGMFVDRQGLSGIVGDRHEDFHGFMGSFARTCTKHSDCEKGFPEEWCMGTGGGKRQCAIMPPVKQTCTQNSECPKTGEECYKKRCVASAPGPARHHHETRRFDLIGSRQNFADSSNRICKLHSDCAGAVPEEWCEGGNLQTGKRTCVVKQKCRSFNDCGKSYVCLDGYCILFYHNKFAGFDGVSEGIDGFLNEDPSTLSSQELSGLVDDDHVNFHGSMGSFARTCTKHSDCEKGFPEEWCMGTGGGKRQCAIMPPVKQTCTQNSECPKAGEECYKKRCVASAPGPARHRHQANFDDEIFIVDDEHDHHHGLYKSFY